MIALLAASLLVGGVTRTYQIHVPPVRAASAPLVLSFHGHGGTGRQQERMTKLDALADRYGFVVVYPDGWHRAWNDGRTQNSGPDDLAFVRALIATVSAQYRIDSRRVYATGFSNGATFTQYLGCTMANRFAAIAPVSGYLPAVDAAACHPRTPLPVLEIGGTADPIMPYGGGEVRLLRRVRGAVLSARATAARWASIDRCAGVPRTKSYPARAPFDGTSLAQTRWPSCAGGSSVVLDTIYGGGHTWPDGSQYAPKALIGPVSHQLDASAAVVKFLLAHRKP